MKMLRSFTFVWLGSVFALGMLSTEASAISIQQCVRQLLGMDQRWQPARAILARATEGGERPLVLTSSLNRELGTAGVRLTQISEAEVSHANGLLNVFPNQLSQRVLSVHSPIVVRDILDSLATEENVGQLLQLSRASAFELWLGSRDVRVFVARAASGRWNVTVRRVLGSRVGIGGARIPDVTYDGMATELGPRQVSVIARTALLGPHARARLRLATRGASDQDLLSRTIPYLEDSTAIASAIALGAVPDFELAGGRFFRINAVPSAIRAAWRFEVELGALSEIHSGLRSGRDFDSLRRAYRKGFEAVRTIVALGGFVIVPRNLWSPDNVGGFPLAVVVNEGFYETHFPRSLSHRVGPDRTGMIDGYTVASAQLEDAIAFLTIRGATYHEGQSRWLLPAPRPSFIPELEAELIEDTEE